MIEPNFQNKAIHSTISNSEQFQHHNKPYQSNQKSTKKSRLKISYKVFENGDLYVGRIKRGKLHGKGLIFFDEPRVRCEGMWLNNLLNGIGRQTGPGSERYVGEFLEGLKSGKGKYINDDQIIIGEFSEGELKGFGVNTDFAKGEILKGNFIEGKMQNFGTIDSLDGQYSFAGNLSNGIYEGLGEICVRDSHYIGNFVKGVKNGIGAYRDFKGYQYIGYWNNGHKHGFGVEKDADGNMFEGSFKENIKNGYCRKFFKDSSTFIGKVRNGGKTGFGKFETKNLVYIGEWLGNKRSGMGYEAYPDGTIYFGSWEKNKKKGYGFECKGDLLMYQGEWLDDKPHGYAVFRNFKGEEKCGLFCEGKLKDITKKIPKGLFEFIEKINIGTFLNEAMKKLEVIEEKVDSKMTQMEREHFDFRSKLRFDYDKLQMKSRELFVSVQSIERSVVSILEDLEYRLTGINLDMNKLMHSFGYDIQDEIEKDNSVVNELNESMEKSSGFLDQHSERRNSNFAGMPFVDSKYLLPMETNRVEIELRKKSNIEKFFKDSFNSRESSPVGLKQVSSTEQFNSSLEIIPSTPIITQREKILKCSRLDGDGLKKEIPRGAMSKKKWNKEIKKERVAALKNLMGEEVDEPIQKQESITVQEKKIGRTFVVKPENSKKNEILNILKKLDNGDSSNHTSNSRIGYEFHGFKSEKISSSEERDISPNTATVKGAKSPRIPTKKFKEDVRSTPKKIMPVRIRNHPGLAKREPDIKISTAGPLNYKEDISIDTVVSAFERSQVGLSDQDIWDVFCQSPLIKTFKLPTERGDSSSKIIKISNSNKFVLSSRNHVTGFKVDMETGDVQFTFEKKFDSEILHIKELDSSRLMILTQDNLQLNFLDKDSIIYNTFCLQSSTAGPPRINLGYLNKVKIKTYKSNINSFLSFNRHGDIALIDQENLNRRLKGNFLDESDKLCYDLISIAVSEKRKSAYILLKCEEEGSSTSILNSVNFSNGSKSSFDLKHISHNLLSATSIDLSLDESVLIYGSVNSHTPDQEDNFDTMYPSLNAVSISQEEIVLKSAMDVQELSEGIGIFSISRVEASNIFLCSSNKNLLVTLFSSGKFTKLKILDFIDDIIYNSTLDGLNFYCFSQKFESLILAKFDFANIQTHQETIGGEQPSQIHSGRVKIITNKSQNGGIGDIGYFQYDKKGARIYSIGNGSFNIHRISSRNEIEIVKSTLPFDAYHFKMFEHNDKIILSENGSNNLLVVDYDLTFLKKLEGVRTQKKSGLSEIKTYGLDADIFMWVKGNNMIVLVNVLLMRQITSYPLFGRSEMRVKGSKFQPVKVLLNEMNLTRKYFSEFSIDGDTYISLKLGEKSVKYFNLQEKLPDIKLIYSVDCTKDGQYLIVLGNSHHNIYKGQKFIFVFDFSIRLTLRDKQILSVKVKDFLPKISRVEAMKKRDIFVVNLSDCFCIYNVTPKGKIILEEIVQDGIEYANCDFSIQGKTVMRIDSNLKKLTESRV